MLRGLPSSLPSRAEPRGRKYEAGNSKANLFHNENTNKTLCTFKAELLVYSVIHFFNHKCSAVMITWFNVQLATGYVPLWNLVQVPRVKPWPMPEVVNEPSQGLLMADGRVLGQDGWAHHPPWLRSWIYFWVSGSSYAALCSKGKSDKERWIMKMILLICPTAARRVISI